MKLGDALEEQRRTVLSVSSNGSTWVKREWHRIDAAGKLALSVSSNGSTWVKHLQFITKDGRVIPSFSILERIDVGETLCRQL